MNKKILLSLTVIAIVAAVGIGGTIAYFSDTETSEGNLFVAGTIDIQVEGNNFDWTGHAILNDMKPCYTDYINFTIHNDGSDPNPVNIWKHLIITSQQTGVVSEPECDEQDGTWNGTSCLWPDPNPDRNDISTIIDYDLSVEVYDDCDNLLWWQTIYNKEVTVAEIACEEIYLGMIPVGGYMKVTQSYHMQDPDYSTNWAQGDIMAFDIEITGIQLRGTAWLENKEGAQPWKIIHDDGIEGTLTYEVKHPTFDFTFTGKAQLTDHEYVLAAGYDANTNVDTYLGQDTTDVNGNITVTGDIELGKDMKDVKVWLVPVESWNFAAEQVIWPNPWTNSYDTFLWETGLIWYEDTDL